MFIVYDDKEIETRCFLANDNYSGNYQHSIKVGDIIDNVLGICINKENAEDIKNNLYNYQDLNERKIYIHRVDTDFDCVINELVNKIIK